MTRPTPSDAQQVATASQDWANELHRDMLAAALLDPNLICFRSVATDEPEAIVRARLMDEMVKEYKPKQVKELQSFLPNLLGNAVK
jgi:hypothetical protein